MSISTTVAVVMAVILTFATTMVMIVILTIPTTMVMIVILTIPTTMVMIVILTIPTTMVKIVILTIPVVFCVVARTRIHDAIARRIGRRIPCVSPARAHDGPRFLARLATGTVPVRL
jgi:hypothetical protein